MHDIADLRKGAAFAGSRWSAGSVEALLATPLSDLLRPVATR